MSRSPGARHVHKPIRDPKVARVFAAHGVHDAADRLVTLRQLHAMLETSIRELDGDHSREELVERAFLVARLTKATCDAFLGMVVGATEALHMGKPFKVVGAAYEAATPLAGAAATWAAGGRIDAVKTIASSVKGGSGLLSEPYEILAKSASFKAEILNAAMHSSKEEILPAARDYLVDLHMTLAKLEEMPEKARRVGAAAEIVKRAIEYNKALGEAFDQMLDAGQESDERYRAQKTMLVLQARSIAHRIRALEREVQAVPPRTSGALP